MHSGGKYVSQVFELMNHATTKRVWLTVFAPPDSQLTINFMFQMEKTMIYSNFMRYKITLLNSVFMHVHMWSWRILPPLPCGWRSFLWKVACKWLVVRFSNGIKLLENNFFLQLQNPLLIKRPLASEADFGFSYHRDVIFEWFENQSV